MCPWYGGEGVKALLVAVIREIGALRSARSAHRLASRRQMSAPIPIFLLESSHATLTVNKKGSIIPGFQRFE